jgi:DNA-binding NtrC family response regulator
LENGEFLRVGSSIARKVDVRVIAATNKDLEAEVRNGNFRQDLFYRLRSVNVRIPSLRERKEDIPLLFEKFIEEFSAKNGIKFGGMTPAATDFIQHYYWQGNVRELRNVVESMLVLERGKKMDVDDIKKYLRVPSNERNLPMVVSTPTDFDERQLLYRALIELKNDMLDVKNILKSVIGMNGASGGNQNASSNAIQENMSLEEMERRMIETALKKYHNNRRLAADELKISERTLYRKIKEYGL